MGIHALRSRIWEDISSNFVSSSPSSVSTKAVSSCGLEISSGLEFGFVESVTPPKDTLEGAGDVRVLFEGTFKALKGVAMVLRDAQSRD